MVMVDVDGDDENDWTNNRVVYFETHINNIKLPFNQLQVTSF